jgi:hypothetical protein
MPFLSRKKYNKLIIYYSEHLGFICSLICSLTSFQHFLFIILVKTFELCGMYSVLLLSALEYTDRTKTGQFHASVHSFLIISVADNTNAHTAFSCHILVSSSLRSVFVELLGDCDAEFAGVRNCCIY